jgi:hypothetical protein
MTQSRRNRILGAVLAVILVALALAVVLGQVLQGQSLPRGLLNTAAQSVPISGWLGEYYVGTELTGTPAVVRDDAEIDFDWGRGAPMSTLPADNFSVRWTRSLEFASDTYIFFASSDDGIRAWVDGELLIDEWHLSPGDTYTASLDLEAGTHIVKVEYYEQGHEARVEFGWTSAEAALYPDWKAEYWDNVGMDGEPLLVQNEGQIDFDWGSGAPAAGLPVDNWSARWTREVTLDPAPYLLEAVVDDGVRVWVDDELILQDWREEGAREVTAEHLFDGRPHQIRVEYFEHGGLAEMRLHWTKVGAATPGPTPFPTADTRYPNWKGSYWSNVELRGEPALVQNEGQIDFSWGSGAAAAGLPVDRWSARWERWVDFAPGTYTFSAQADDGVRFYLDGQLLIDEWPASGQVTYTVERELSGRHYLQVEYYEDGGLALVRFGWERRAGE